MNGGKTPIKGGDLLLLEWVNPTNAGSISDLTLAIETQDDTGDDQYLLRVVKKSDKMITINLLLSILIMLIFSPMNK
jgi:hypothetical protein